MKKQLFILLASMSFSLSATQRCPKDAQVRHAMYYALAKTTGITVATAAILHWALAAQQISK
jgi:hypothetical protein